MKKTIVILSMAVAAALMCCQPASAQKRHESRKMGDILVPKDSSSHAGRLLDNRLFIPKGSIGLGLQFSYYDLSSTDSELLLLLQNLDAGFSYFGAAPSLSYCIADNRVIGARFRYVNAEINVGEVDLSLLGAGDLNFNVKDMRGNSNSMISEVFYSSYIGIDDMGRFGLFANVGLQYANTRTSFGSGVQAADTYNLSRRLKLAVRPGLEVFVLNNISTMFSVGIGGISYTNNKCYRGGEVTGVLNSSKARFMLDITDIAMGMTIHF